MNPCQGDGKNADERACYDASGCKAQVIHQDVYDDGSDEDQPEGHPSLDHKKNRDDQEDNANEGKNISRMIQGAEKLSALEWWRRHCHEAEEFIRAEDRKEESEQIADDGFNFCLHGLFGFRGSSSLQERVF